MQKIINPQETGVREEKKGYRFEIIIKSRNCFSQMKGEIEPIKSAVKFPLTLIGQGFNLKITCNMGKYSII